MKCLYRIPYPSRIPAVAPTPSFIPAYPPLISMTKALNVCACMVMDNMDSNRHMIAMRALCVGDDMYRICFNRLFFQVYPANYHLLDGCIFVHL